MRMTKCFVPTLREVPADAVITSQKLMLRAGLLRKIANGLFAYLPLGLRSFRKLEAIIREEMDAIGALEIKPSVIVPGELWKESGRWETMGEEMLRVKNRQGADFVVSPTAEEVFTAIVRDELSSYKQLPLTLYQINTKYRDEIRPRYGVMRGREFTMKDAYSFHADASTLDEVYELMGAAYRRIFKRCGLSVIPVKADTGAMGGTGSEEFMVQSHIGDNTLILCPACGYAANVETASCKPDREARQPTEDFPARVHTPEVKTIEELCTFLNSSSHAFIKTLIYKASNARMDLSAVPGCQNLKRVKAAAGLSDYYENVEIAVCIRGDLDVNENKLCAALKASEVTLAENEAVERVTGAPVGFAGPVGLLSIPILCDDSVMELHDAYTGGLEKDLHLAHVEPGRDFKPILATDLRTVKSGDACPHCSTALYEKKGNELGHIFKLGAKYTNAMKVNFLDESGKSAVPIMGCYGIGLDRTLASVIEEHNDENGIVWPMSLTPYQVAIVPVRYEGEMKAVADTIYEHLLALGLEVLLDDRMERPGVKFKDLDLVGIPLRITVGDKNLPNVEFKARREKEFRLLDPLAACSLAAETVKAELAILRA